LSLGDMKFHLLRQIKGGKRMEAIRKRARAVPSDLEKFVREQNIAAYRKLLGDINDEARRATIAKLLNDELAKLKKT
jgi:hypothetical protein